MFFIKFFESGIKFTSEDMSEVVALRMLRFLEKDKNITTARLVERAKQF